MSRRRHLPCDYCEGKYGQSHWSWYALNQIRRKGLADVTVQCAGNVDDRVSDHELECPASGTTNCTRQEYRSRACDVGIAAFFSKMEGRVVAKDVRMSSQSRSVK